MPVPRQVTRRPQCVWLLDKSGKLRARRGTYRHADEVDGHKEEVDAAAEVRQSDGPDLRDDDAADGTARGGKVETAGADRRGKDLAVQVVSGLQVSQAIAMVNPYLGAVNPCCRSEAEAVAHGVDEDEDYANHVCDLVGIAGERQRQRSVDLKLKSATL